VNSCSCSGTCAGCTALPAALLHSWARPLLSAHLVLQLLPCTTITGRHSWLCWPALCAGVGTAEQLQHPSMCTSSTMGTNNCSPQCHCSVRWTHANALLSKHCTILCAGADLHQCRPYLEQQRLWQLCQGLQLLQICLQPLLQGILVLHDFVLHSTGQHRARHGTCLRQHRCTGSAAATQPLQPVTAANIRRVPLPGDMLCAAAESTLVIRRGRC